MGTEEDVGNLLICWRNFMGIFRHSKW